MTSEVRVDPAFHRFLIGRNGTNLRELSEKTGARVVFPSAADHNNDCIVIIGRQDAISRATDELEARIKDLVSCSSSGGCSCSDCSSCSSSSATAPLTRTVIVL